MLSVLHRKMLKQHYFPVIGSVPKRFVGRNRRGLDMSVAQFEGDAEKSVDRSAWGLPEPNKEAAYLSLAKYAKDVPSMAPSQVIAMNTAWEWTQRHFGIHMMNSRVKSVEEVISGIDMSTSPGFPWNRKYKTKKMMHDDWKDEFPKYMHEDWDRLKSNDYVAVFGNSLKEEIRPKEKIDLNSLRTFTAGPVEMTIHGNRLFEDMNQKMYDSHLQTASVVGFSPWKGGWNELYTKLCKFQNGFALDESQYDSSLRSYMMWGCARFRWAMLRPEDQTEDNLQRLLVYYRNLINTVIVTSEGVFVMKTGGNPSGSVNTISDNTLILFTLIAYGWIRTATPEMLTFEKFEANLALALCGDDNTWTVSDAALPFFNAKSLIAEWKEIGITTTTDSMDPRPPVELDFLSAHTVFVNGKAVPLYDRSKLLTSLLYSSEPDNPSYTLIRACALLRVGWADVATRGYLKELIQWLVKKYNRILINDPEWISARQQIPSEEDCLKLFIGVPESKQGYGDKSATCPPEKAPLSGKRERLERRIKRYPSKEKKMNGIVPRPQRQRGRRSRKRAGNPPPLPPRGAQYAAAVAAMQQSLRSTRGKGRGRGGRGRRNRRRNASRRMLTMRGPTARIDGIRARRRKPFSNDEFITDIVDSTTTAIVSYPVNPGQASTFPWLSKEAVLYEKYVITQLEYYYKREVSEFAADGTTGKIVMSFDYDASDAPPTSKQQQLDTDPHADGMPCDNFVLRVDCREGFNNGPKYVRPGGLPGATDIKTYDMGNLNVGAYGNAASGNKVGELHVRYSGYFEKPVLEATNSAPANNTVAWFLSGIAESVATGVPHTLNFTNEVTNGVLATNTGGLLVLPAGNYLLDGWVWFADDTNEAFAGTVTVKKNAASIFPATPAFTQSAVASPDATLPFSGYITMNGTDTLEVDVTAVGAAGAMTAYGSLMITAI